MGISFFFSSFFLVGVFSLYVLFSTHFTVVTFFERAFLQYSGDSLLFALLILSFFFYVIVPPEDDDDDDDDEDEDEDGFFFSLSFLTL